VTLKRFTTLLTISAAMLASKATTAQISGFETAAPHAVIMDSATGLVLFEKDARRPVPPASMTKILTAEMVFDALREGRITMDTEFKVSEEAFRNATGWPHEEHRISTYDLAQLGQRSVERYPEFYGLYSEKDFTWNGIRQGNRNPLLGQFTGADGLKTGHTEVSGYGLVGSAKRGDDRRIIVLNGLDSKRQRREESVRLMTAAFDSFSAYKLYDANQSVGPVKVYMGVSDEVDAVIPQDLHAGLYRPDRSKLRTQMRYKTVAAPIAKGDVIAELIVMEPGKPERAISLVAADDVARLGAVGRAMKSLKTKIGG